MHTQRFQIYLAVQQTGGDHAFMKWDAKFMADGRILEGEGERVCHKRVVAEMRIWW